jgi:uncharacterized protein
VPRDKVRAYAWLLTVGEYYTPALHQARELAPMLSEAERSAARQIADEIRKNPPTSIEPNPTFTTLANERAAAESGDAAAQFSLALFYMSMCGQPEPDQVISWLEKASASKYPPAMHLLAMRLGEGRLLPKDEARGLKLLREAAEAGLAAAEHNLGLLYQGGNGVPQDYAESVRWYRRAAQKGYAAAQNALGFRFENGQGVPKDKNEALRLYRLAAGQGEPEALNNMGWMYLGEGGMFLDYKEARRWFELAAAQWNPPAFNFLGRIYERGLGVAPDLIQAFAYYQLGERSGNDDARQNLAVLRTRLTVNDATLGDQRAADWAAMHPRFDVNQ